MSASLSPASSPLEDPLAYLPCSAILRFRRGQVIYTQSQPCMTALYLVLEGRIKVSRIADAGHEVVVDIYQTDDFFGESAFLNLSHHCEQATAIEETRLMAWTNAEILSITSQRPQLGVALVQILAQRSARLCRRIESFGVDNVERRLARSLIHFSERMGTVESDGWVSTGSITHELLSQYVGTSREIVTSFMNHFRRNGLLRYTRKRITVNREALKNWLG